MTPRNRQTVQDEVKGYLATDMPTYLGADGVNTVIASSQIYTYMPAKLGGASPAVLVLGGPIDRKFAGVGTSKYENEIEFEIHNLVYDGPDNNPLTEENREKTMNLLEMYVAQSLAGHQTGTSYRALRRNGPTNRTAVKYLDGAPYQLEIIKLVAETRDA